MVKIKITRKDNLITSIVISGHSEYDIPGKDIVCSAISSITITTINGINLLDRNFLKASDDKGISIMVLKENQDCMKLLENMVSLLQELCKQYPKNIQIK